MGDRGNIVIRDNYPADVRDKEAVFLYGHWSGTELPEIARAALERAEGRWDDAQYLARIVFEDMIADDLGGLTGYGITTQIADNEYDLIVLRPDRQVLARVTEKEYKANGFAALDDAPSIPFENYVAASERTWDNLTSAEVAA
jgi:hypothetical protein